MSLSVPRKVLIIEDEEVFAENLKTYFKRCGWNPRIACNGKAAVSTAGEFIPEFIVLDFQLPDMNGFQALEAIRANQRCLGCVLMTGHPADAVAAEARRHGIERILYKPFSLAAMQTELLAVAASLAAKPAGSTGS
jgi:CheY-like chemotaxis protein